MTLYGAAVTARPEEPSRKWEDLVIDHERDCGAMQILRSYDGGAPLNFFSKSDAGGSRAAGAPGWTRRASWHSMKPDVTQLASGSLDGWARDYLDSIPVTGHRRMLTLWHEPKSKIASGTFTADAWKRALYRFGRIVREYGHPDVQFGPCFAAQWDLTGAGNLDSIMAANDVDLFSVCDFIGWDPYHEGSKSGDYSDSLTPGHYIDPLLSWSLWNAPGLPVCIGETGVIPSATDPDARPRWIESLADYVQQKDIEVVCYFDASAGNPWWLRRAADGTFDEQSSRTWGLHY